MKLVLPQAVIIHNPEPQMVGNAPIFWARVQYLGGELRTPNPNKFNGNASDVEIEVRLQAAGKTFANRETKQVSGGIALELKCVGILAAKLTK